MEVGIVSYGVYLPRYRLNNKTLAEAWRRPADKSGKAVANFDEDSLTLATESCFNALDNCDNATPDSLSFASTTFPYQEKLSANIITALLDLPETTRTQDFAHSLRAGTMALIKASEDLKAGYSKLSLVTAADCRTAQPGSDLEPFIGDGGACLLLGTDRLIAKVVETYSISSDFTDIWRKDTDTYINSGDMRFGQEFGYTRLMEMAINGMLKKIGRGPQDFAKVILTPRDARSHLGLSKIIGFDPKTQLQDVTSFIGFTGTAHPFIALCAVLETAKPKDKILLASYGDGCDVIILEVTNEIKKTQDKKLFQIALTRRKELTSYTKFLEFRELLKGQPKIAAEAFTSLIMQNREQDIMMQLKAKKCQKCQMILTLRQKVCSQCGAIDKPARLDDRSDGRRSGGFEEVKLSRTGKIYTYTQEYYYPSPEPPTTMAVIDLDARPPEPVGQSGGRILLQMTDTDADKVQIGMPVKLTYRKMHEAGGFYNYYWKCRPL